MGKGSVAVGVGVIVAISEDIAVNSGDSKGLTAVHHTVHDALSAESGLKESVNGHMKAETVLLEKKAERLDRPACPMGAPCRLN